MKFNNNIPIKYKFNQWDIHELRYYCLSSWNSSVKLSYYFIQL